jgi:hypothetical protein
MLRAAHRGVRSEARTRRPSTLSSPRKREFSALPTPYYWIVRLRGRDTTKADDVAQPEPVEHEGIVDPDAVADRFGRPSGEEDRTGRRRCGLGSGV